MISKCSVCIVILGIAVRLVLSQIDGYTPGEDYPIYNEVPHGLSFKCENRIPGYYSDPEAQCQVWHWCLPSGQQFSFLCPNGTIFNQFARVCDWWFNVDCAATPNLYNINEDLYIVTPYQQQQQQDQQRSRRHSTRVIDDLEMVASYNFQPPQQPQPFQPQQQQQTTRGRRQSVLAVTATPSVIQRSNNNYHQTSGGNDANGFRQARSQQQQQGVRGRRHSTFVVAEEKVKGGEQRERRRRQPVNWRS